MKIYLVGGAVRDKLLGLEPKERDWVVVGSTPQEMKKNGFKQVGKDFPVFIHPNSGEEYALARTERKSGHGYTGFEFNVDSNVSLEEDLERRDLTINAIAEDEAGNLIDPYQGQKDIKNKKLRHVSVAFSEDPLRVLRLARFQVKFPEFTIAPETINMVREIVDSGELEYLTGERIWLEMYKSDNIGSFYDQLVKLGLIDKIKGFHLTLELLPYRKDVLNGCQSLKKIHQISYFIYRLTRSEDDFCDELKIPNEYRDLARMLRQCEVEIKEYIPKKDQYDKLLDLINKLDVRKTERLKDFFECVDISDDKKIFFESLIDKIRNFRLDEEQQKKSKDEIIKLIKNTHKEIAQNHITNYLDSQ